MDAHGSVRRGAGPAAPVIGLATIALVVACAIAWIVDWNAIAALSGLAAVAVGATVAGADSRQAGDWTPPDRG